MAYIELHTHTSWQKNSQEFSFKWTAYDCSCAPLLDATSSENGYPTTEELLCSTVSEERVCNSCATCISHTLFCLDPPSQVSIYTWYKKFEQKGCICKCQSWLALCMWCNCGPCSDLLQMQPTKISTPRESWVAAITKSCISIYLRNCNLQLAQALKPEDMAIW
jgi:hypothetical protein